MDSQPQSTLERSRFSRGSETVTGGWRVTVHPSYLEELSAPEEHRFVFGYRIRIRNESPRPARLITRHWVIIDARGAAHTVDGEGVVGQQPVLEPGAAHEYESYCPLPTAWGTMEGHYAMRAEDGGVFRIAVARFYFVAPHQAPPGRAPGQAVASRPPGA